MKELFPNGYTKPVIINSKILFNQSKIINIVFVYFIEPIERQRPRRIKSSIYWSRRSIKK